MSGWKRRGWTVGKLVASGALATALSAGGAAAQTTPGGGALGWLSVEPAAPSDPISTGRPSFSAGPGTVPRGFLQIEGGYVSARNESDTTHTAPLLVFRAGVGDGLELRLGWTGIVVSETGGGTETDAGDVVLGFKRTFREPSNGPATLGLLAQVSLPIGEGSATSGSFDPSMGLLWSHDVAGPVSLFGNVVVSSFTNSEDDRQTRLGASLGAGFPLAPRLDGYVEYFGVFADEGAPSNNVNGGLLYLVTDNLQLDVFASAGVSEAADDLALGTGFGVRF